MEIKTFVGYAFGRFEADDGRMLNYCNVFVLEDFAGEENDEYHFAGKKAVKYGCTSPAVFRGIPENTEVLCFFDSKKKISYMVSADKGGQVMPGENKAS